MGIQLEKLTPQEREHLLSGEFGLEKENLRVDAEGYLSHTPHPFPNDPKRDRDFCENQVEMITGVHDTVHGAWEELRDIHQETLDVLKKLPTGEEYLWSCSNPPYVRCEEDIPVATFTGELADKTEYRYYLAEKYGKKKMLFSGIHYNFSFSDQLLQADFAHSGQSDFQTYKNKFYMDLAGKVLRKSWLIVYLTAASPVMDGSYHADEKIGQTTISPYASPRCSKIGYWNLFLPVLDFSTLESYVDSIQSYVDDGQLRQTSELYYPVRLKPRGANDLQNLKKTGVNHIELRMFDLNPLSSIGIDERDMEFVYYLLLHLALLPDETTEVADQIAAIRNMKEAALLNQEQISVETKWLQSYQIAEAAEIVLEAMEKNLKDIVPAEKLAASLDYQRSKIRDKSVRYADRLVAHYGDDFVQKMLSELKLK